MSSFTGGFKAMSRGNQVAVVLGLIIFVALIAFGIVMYVQLKETREELASRTLALQTDIQELTDQASRLRTENDGLQNELDREKRRNEDFEDQIKDISGTVSELDKLRKIDPELLKKYSKVYFLNENYFPKTLAAIDSDFASNPKQEVKVLRQVEPFLEDLLEEAQDDKVDLKVVSAYRSFETQASVKTGYQVLYGSGANAFSADQGYSEHQLGTTVDFSSPAINNALTVGFETTPAFKWLQDNAHKYGFVLSYPKGNAYYQYEPWHWRFVGVDLARDLNKKGKNFYDLDQREIDSYLIKIFD